MHATFCVSQLNDLTMFQLSILVLTFLPPKTKGQQIQFLHMFMSGDIFCSLVLNFGMLDFIRLSLMFLCICMPPGDGQEKIPLNNITLNMVKFGLTFK